jgi:hypothetical protein
LLALLVDEIEVNYLGCDSWYPAIYVQPLDSSTARIRYVDGEQEEDVPIDWIRLPPATETDGGGAVSDVALVTSSSTSEETESKNLLPHKLEVTPGPSPDLSSSPQSDNISSYFLNGQMSIPSTVTSIGPIGSDEDIQYEHKTGIGSDDSPSLASYEILQAMARLHGSLAKKYESQQHQDTSSSSPSSLFYSQLCGLAVQYFNEASTDAFDSGKTAFAMKCLEEASEFE